jgi:hypothetical protein
MTLPMFGNVPKFNGIYFVLPVFIRNFVGENVALWKRQTPKTRRKRRNVPIVATIAEMSSTNTKYFALNAANC